MKKICSLILALCLLAALPAMAADYSDIFTDYDLRASWTAAVIITFGENGVEINGSGAAADGNTVRITEKGTYLVSGECENGQILVEVDKEDKVQLVLSGLTLTCADSAPIYVISADKVSLTLAPDTVNTLTDGAAYTREFEHMPNACIYSRDDLTINGAGALIVNGNYNNGIGTKNDLKIVGGEITVTAKKNALKGNDSVAICGGSITLNAGKDAIKAENEDEEGKGYVYIAGGALDITAGDDAIQAQQDVTVTGGTILVSARGKIINSKGTQDVDAGVITKK
ncbi:MAG: carbohydrate-binding domain-containing protein [Clostridia bacterium]|nr:carbohydrate-binding domain-containing protein [Clostridia bacterium]